MAQKEGLAVKIAENVGLPKTKVWIIWVIGLGGLTFGMYKLISSLTKDEFGGLSAGEMGEKITRSEIKEGDESKISRSKTELESRTRNIYNAMDKFGTDEETIFRNLQGLNKNDLLYMMKVFGIKPYYGGTHAATWFVHYKKNMKEWLKAELSGSDLKKVKKIFLENGITW